MPPKNVHEYVRGRNVMPDGAHAKHTPGGGTDFDDIKVPVTLPNSNMARARSPQNLTATAGVPEQMSQRGQRASGDQKAFYDTDAGSIDDTSTTASVPGTHAAEGPVSTAMHHAERPRSDAGNSLASDEEYVTERDNDDGGDDDDNYELPADPLQDHPSQKKQELQQQPVGRARDQRPDGSGLPYMKGDSYPSTTDGIPSVSDVAERKRSHAEAHAMPRPAIVLVNRTGQHSGAHVGHGQNQSQRRLSRAQQPTKHTDQQRGHYESRPSVQPPVVQQINGASPFSLPGPKYTMPKALQHAPAMMYQPGSRQPASTDTAQVGFADHGRERRPQQQTPTGPAMARDPKAAAPDPQREKTKSSRESRPVNPTEQPAIEQVQQHRQHVETQRKAQKEPPGGVQAQHEQPHEPELQLDFDIPDLYGMSYGDLKAAEFDRNPANDDFALSGRVLEDEMHTVSAMAAHDQARFFSTLDINQWEEAGEWFLGRFGETLSKLKDARQEKRKAAHMFEDEIERRHGAVSKKRKVTEDALGEMKASGALVLQGTPNKAKRTR
ncbi:hypothetical protein B0A55_02149 [Friedmanniomyces simplex]|uniref:Extracellular mutant protein 11 C-terminal domain-containing protein n=1 Tax=Friedmanniomyces simplex TaxID=329884 RepID=A0A4U0Y199_9PEZI|nr:hypothetical protein B0A55_02149 [Friedmanniomyces simplex]